MNTFLDIDGPLNTGRGEYMDPERFGHHFDDMGTEEALDGQETHWIIVNPHTGISLEDIVLAI